MKPVRPAATRQKKPQNAIARHAFYAGVLLILCAIACQPAATQPNDPSSPIPTPDLPSQKPTRADLTEAQAALCEDAKRDLAERLQVPVTDITLLLIEPVLWRDSSLGCPRPGMQYLQVITQGYVIKLEAGGQQYEYHSSESRVEFCEQP